MDNITHSLIGASIGELATKQSPKNRAWYWFASILASSAPDIDVVAPLFLGEAKITGLLHHRGHTHTYLVSFLLALLCYAIVLGVAKLRGHHFHKAERRTILLLTALGVIFHIIADSWNSYGVHPYWPIDSHWYYGDFVFIIEPWIWIFLAPALALSVRNRVVQGTFVAIILFLLLLAWQVSFVHWLTKVSLILGSLVVPFLLNRMKEGRRIFVALTLVGAILGTLWLAKSSIKKTINNLDSNLKIFDAATNPYPGNPFCWNAFISSTDQDAYSVRIGTIALMPNFIDLSWCPRPRHSSTTAPLVPVTSSSSPYVKWWGEYRGDLKDLQKLQQKSCAARAVLKFMRMPYWIEQGNGQWILGDLRFDRDEKIGFTEFEIDLNQEDKCPPAIPSWVEPLAPLLAPRAITSSATTQH